MTKPRAPSWAVTKLRPPELRGGIQERPRLSAILNSAVNANEPLVLVSAPAGSGKSTAVASWAASRPDLHTVWMQVDAADNDPVRFWTALVDGLAGVDPRISDIVGPILTTPKADFIESALPALVNSLDQATDIAIVLDDYQLIRSEELHSELTALIEAAPRGVTVIVATRHDPPLRLGRLRVRGQLSEIRAADLRFDTREAATILANEDLTEAEIETLCERTEGWAAGLVLASVSLARTTDAAAFVANFAGDNRMVVDYLSTELWDSLDPPVRQFFLEISVLDKMCGPLVDALLDKNGEGAIWLETASRDNQLIIRLDDRGQWYRFHHLLQEQLQTRLKRDDPGRYATLHRKAAGWFDDHGETAVAIRHALVGGDVALAAQLVGNHGSVTFSAGHLVTVQGWLQTLGDAVIDGDARLAVLRVWTLIVDGDWHNLDRPIAVARQLLGNDFEGPNAALLRGSILAADALAATAKGNIGAALSLLNEVTERPEIYEVTSLVNAILGSCLTWRGDHDLALAPLEECIATAPIEEEHLIYSSALISLAIIACAVGDHGRAAYLAQQALDTAQAHHLSEYHQLALAHSLLGRTLATQDADRAAEAGSRGVTLARRSDQPITIAFALVSHAEILIVQGNSIDATTMLVEARRMLERCDDPGMVLTFLARTEAHLGPRAPQNDHRIGAGADELTARELTVLRLLPSRLSVREIASELYVSHNTAKGHLKAVYRKLNVNDRQTAVQRARELDLL